MKGKNKILSSLNNSIFHLARLFLTKQGFFEEIDGCVVTFDYEFLGDVLDVIEVSGYYIGVSDILLDIKNDIPSGIYFKYYDYYLEQALSNNSTTNYFTYLLQNGYKLHR